MPEHRHILRRAAAPQSQQEPALEEHSKSTDLAHLGNSTEKYHIHTLVLLHVQQQKRLRLQIEALQYHPRPILPQIPLTSSLHLLVTHPVQHLVR